MNPIPDDDLSKLEAKGTAHVLPAGWLLLFFGLIAWGVWYAWEYTPALGGWSQAKELDAGGPSSGAGLVATIGFTAAAALVAVVLVVVQRGKGRR